jgi:hypothetical protein
VSMEPDFLRRSMKRAQDHFQTRSRTSRRGMMNFTRPRMSKTRKASTH